jgi:hypothetical protein
MDSTGSRSDWVSGIAGVATALGVLTFALFPLALPILILTIVWTLPLALPLVAFTAIAAILTGAWLGIRAAGRAISRLVLRPGHAGVTRARRERGTREALHGC